MSDQYSPRPRAMGLLAFSNKGLSGLALSVLLLLLLGALLLNGCSQDVPTERVVRHIIADVDAGEETVGSSGLRVDSDELGQVRVYVDRSQSMMPYTAEVPSRYSQLLGSIGDFIESEAVFHGFGYVASSDSTQEVEEIDFQRLLRPSTYSFANNDYAALFDEFDHDGSTHLVITDGVQSDPDDKARLGVVSGALQNWIDEGGAFAILLYRTPYVGQYYSDLEGANPRYNCSDRPLVVFALAPSGSAIDELIGRLEQDGLAPEHAVRIGRDLEMYPASETVAGEGERRGTVVMRDVQEQIYRGLEPVYEATVMANRTADANGFMPFQLEAVLDTRNEPWRGLSVEEREQFLKGLEPSLEGWYIDRRALEQPDSLLGGSPLEYIGDLEVRGETEVTIEAEDDTLRARYAIPVRKPDFDHADRQRQRHPYYGVLARLVPDEQSARMLIPSNYSTNNDLLPESCSAILKLERLIGQIILRNYVPGQVLLVTEWR